MVELYDVCGAEIDDFPNVAGSEVPLESTTVADNASVPAIERNIWSALSESVEVGTPVVESSTMAVQPDDAPAVLDSAIQTESIDSVSVSTQSRLVETSSISSQTGRQMGVSTSSQCKCK